MAVADQQARLAAAAVADDDYLLGVGWTFRHVRRGRFAPGRVGVAAHHSADRPIARSGAAGVSSIRRGRWLALDVALVRLARRLRLVI